MLRGINYDFGLENNYKMTGLILLTEVGAILLCRRWLAHSVVHLVSNLGGSASAGVWVYSILTLPGILAHEIAHFLVAALMGLRTGSIELLPTLASDGGVELGSVQVERKDPIRLALVGLAPLLFGVPLLLWLASTVVPPQMGTSDDLLALARLWWVFPNSLMLYLLTTIALHMFPSNRDMNTWPIAALLVSAIVGGLMLLGVRIPQTASIFTQLQLLMPPLAAGLAVVLAVVLVALLLILLATRIIKAGSLYNKSR
jgi:hypothetical protein